MNTIIAVLFGAFCVGIGLFIGCRLCGKCDKKEIEK
jgi:uncharacterized protein YneF (UPF0154 family)